MKAQLRLNEQALPAIGCHGRALGAGIACRSLVANDVYPNTTESELANQTVDWTSERDSWLIAVARSRVAHHFLPTAGHYRGVGVGRMPTGIGHRSTFNYGSFFEVLKNIIRPMSCYSVLWLQIAIRSERMSLPPQQ